MVVGDCKKGWFLTGSEGWEGEGQLEILPSWQEALSKSLHPYQWPAAALRDHDEWFFKEELTMLKLKSKFLFFQ